MCLYCRKSGIGILEGKKKVEPQLESRITCGEFIIYVRQFGTHTLTVKAKRWRNRTATVVIRQKYHRSNQTVCVSSVKVYGNECYEYVVLVHTGTSGNFSGI